MKLSLVIPAHNEEECIKKVIDDIISELQQEKIDYEIVAVNDNSNDRTREIMENLASCNSYIKIINREPPPGFGRAITEGLLSVTGDVVGTVMGDLSDDPRDIVSCFREIEKGYDCVFGSRFMKGSMVRDYPSLKLLINRIANNFIRILFFIKANDITNAFKFYKREVIESIKPIQSLYFNITIELPLKAIVNGYSYTQIPINWYGRKSGVSKLSIREMGRKYFAVLLKIWFKMVFVKMNNIKG